MLWITTNFHIVKSLQVTLRFINVYAQLRGGDVLQREYTSIGKLFSQENPAPPHPGFPPVKGCPGRGWEPCRGVEGPSQPLHAAPYPSYWARPLAWHRPHKPLIQIHIGACPNFWNSRHSRKPQMCFLDAFVIQQLVPGRFCFLDRFSGRQEGFTA